MFAHIDLVQLFGAQTNGAIEHHTFPMNTAWNKGVSVKFLYLLVPKAMPKLNLETLNQELPIASSPNKDTQWGVVAAQLSGDAGFMDPTISLILNLDSAGAFDSTHTMLELLVQHLQELDRHGV